MPDFAEITANFFPGAGPVSVRLFTSGHIHASYRLDTETAGTGPFFLQRINRHVFPDVHTLMENIDRVTTFLARKSPDDPYVLPEKLRLYRTLRGELFYTDPEGEAWRMFNFLEHTHSVNRVSTVEQAYEGGKAFGRFLLAFADFDARLLHITLPRFHDLDFRMEQFRTACALDPKNRLSEVFPEIRIVKETAPDLAKFWQLISNFHVPVRITHNDTKFNNVLLNAEGKAVCIVDLDTVMPGSMLFDFGDAIRTLSNTAGEDEPDLSLVGFHQDFYKAFTDAYLENCQSTLTRIEMIHMPYAALYMTFLIGLRFLTDYLNGDIYYHINHPAHNLDRARVQFKLLSEMQEHLNFMKQI